MVLVVIPEPFKNKKISLDRYFKNTQNPNNDTITPSYFNSSFGTLINSGRLSGDYPKTCFEYIHMNPVMDKLVSKPEEWEFSSYRDYYSGRNGKLISYERAEVELGIIMENLL
jgi:hypothetical protein